MMGIARRTHFILLRARRDPFTYFHFLLRVLRSFFMLTFSQSSFAAVALFASSALAAPHVARRQSHTHHTRTLANGAQVQTYHPAAHFETFGNGIDSPLGKRADFRAAGISFLGSKLGGEDSFTVKSTSETVAGSHVYVAQKLNNITVANAVANVALNKAGRVTSWANTFVTPSSVALASPKLSADQAMAMAESFLGGKSFTKSSLVAHHDGISSLMEPTLEYYALDTGKVVLVHSVLVEVDGYRAVEAYVNAESGEVHGIYDFTAHLTFHAIPLWKQSADDGFETIANPENALTSPKGWEMYNGTDSNMTQGNNVLAYHSTDSTFANETSANTYDYTFDPTLAPNGSTNLQVALSNAFYVVNSVHDITYLYGFTEATFNFQADNYGKGGTPADPVHVLVQDQLATDNAAFTTFPDGFVGMMRMFEWTKTTPRRDGALANDILAHEATHGLTNRMTGGGTARCLGTNESQSLGEGWSDAFADWVHQTSSPIRDFVPGMYVYNNTQGIRTHIYSTNKDINPLLYSDLADRVNDVHDAGEIWANTLHNVLAELVDEFGFADDARTNANGEKGNQVWLHLFIDALPIQPCNPTFLQARDAWIQADVNRYEGKHVCSLWKTFASRGFGANAGGKQDDFEVPRDCTAAAP
ncbi:Fungalysin metallopeptidase-domain-containing protein [Auriculariales sp. MPI-PUGE-AT-0066]|nr:Fungalysin metallopeptidase-domain-containing protein [Auriculariales sp. MPI-PUGE-AT-0066]